jgi:PleD family two-component response regulator
MTDFNDDHLSSESSARIYLALEESHFAQQLALETRHFGYKTRVFDNLEVMSNAGQVAPPDLIVIDMGLIEHTRTDEHYSAAPEANRHYEEREVAGLVKSILHPVFEAAGRALPIVFLAEEDTLALRLEAIHFGGSGFFQKPVNVSVFLNRIQQITRREGKRKEEIFVITDGSPTLAHCEEMLKNQGFNITEQTDINHTLRLINELRPDLVLINGDMIHVQAMDIARVIRQEDQLFGLPIVVLTKRDKRMFDAAASDLGIDALIGLPVEGSDLAAICQARIERARNLKSEYSWLSRRDALTGLYNQNYLYEQMTQAISLSAGKPTAGALIYVHLDRIGEAGGENGRFDRAMAVEIGNSLQKIIDPPHIAAKLDRHSYAALIYSSDEREIERYSDVIKSALKKIRVEKKGERVSGHYSLGVSLFGGQTKSVSEVFKRAQACSEIESYGESTPERGQEWMERWVKEVESALNEERFRLVYQPIANLAGHPQSYFEVFLRMQDEYGADILPQEFLPAAEQGGFTAAIDRWVIEQACHVMSEQAGSGNLPTLFIKIFPSTLDDPDFGAYIRQKIKAAYSA